MDSAFEKDLSALKTWYSLQKWIPSDMQNKTAEAILNNKNGLLNAPTGSGKTYAVLIPLLLKLRETESLQTRIIWVTPLKALAKDTESAIQKAISELWEGASVAIRTGDIQASERQKQIRKPPTVLITTPESLHLLLAQKSSLQFFYQLAAVVVDEWHELLGTKRGVQVELALAYLKSKHKNLQAWGISATIGNLKEAMKVLLYSFKNSVLIKAPSDKNILIQTVLPDTIENFPKSGHTGLSIVPKIGPIIQSSETCLIFTNTRAQSEKWYHELLTHYPELAGQMAIHHGSLDKTIRTWVEWAIHHKIVKVVVCTSSLDLGVDFRPVDTVIQIGSPKGIARFVQRAGRSGHAPGLESIIYFVPTHSLELIEAMALKEAVRNNNVESRVPLRMTFDTLIQFCVSLACGPGFNFNELQTLLKKTHAFEWIEEKELKECLGFIENGGASFQSYPEFNKVKKDKNGTYTVCSRRIAFQHRIQIGTIFSIEGIRIKNSKGKSLGSVELYFISRLKEGDCFTFAGKKLRIVSFFPDYVKVEDAPNNAKSSIPAWMGGRLSFSSEITEELGKILALPASKLIQFPEWKLLSPLMKIQSEVSIIPNRKQLLIEVIQFQKETHLFCYPFEGRKVNEAIAMLIAYRIGKSQSLSFSISVNDYGFELFCNEIIKLKEEYIEELFSPTHLWRDLESCQNHHEMVKKRFAEISSIAGMHPKQKNTNNKHLQHSAALLYKVLSDFEPNHILLRQAAWEVGLHFREDERLLTFMKNCETKGIVLKILKNYSPFSFPLMAEGLRERLSTEKIEEKLDKILAQILN